MIPASAKKEYLEALRLAPRLIQTESDPIKFLRCEDFNPWTAAKRLVLYWEYRKWLFQEHDRWLLPMNNNDNNNNETTSGGAAGGGCLCSATMDVLNNGWLAFVVSSDDDEKGRFLVVDHGRYKGHSPDVLLRAVFYLAAMASDRVAQTRGVTAIRLLSSTQHGGEPPFSMQLVQAAQTAWRMLKTAMPMRLNKVVLLQEMSTTTKRGTMVNFFLRRVGSTIAQLLGDSSPILLAVPSAAQAAQTLQEDYGLAWKDVLPTTHGGTWTYDRLGQWKQRQQRQRQQQQQQQDSAASNNNNNKQQLRQQETNEMGKLVKIPWLAAQVHDDHPDNSNNEHINNNNHSNDDDDEGQQQQRCKQVNALYARRAYHKRKLKQNERQQEAKRLRAENERLKREREFLENLLQQAMHIIAFFASAGGGGGGGNNNNNVAI